MIGSGARDVAAALRAGERSLCEGGLSNARLESLWLLAAALELRGRKPAELYLQSDRLLEVPALARFEGFLRRRLEREPLAYILGAQEFLGLPFEVTPDVLIPRQETELLAEECLKRILKLDQPRVLDVGTGSGCLAVSLAKFAPRARLWALDVSEPALTLARKNAFLNGAADRIEFVQSDLLQDAAEELDLIVSNPPYVKSENLEGLQPEVRREPRLALDGGGDGLRVIERLVRAAPGHLASPGWLLLEVGEGQADAVLRLLEAAGFLELGLIKDYAGIERIVIGKHG